MKTLILAASVALVALLGLPRPAAASPFDASRVPATAEGVGHVDVDALRKTTIYSLVSAKLLKDGKLDIDPKMRPIATALMNSAQGVTFWMGNDTGAAIVKLSSTTLVKPLLDKMATPKTVTIGGKSVARYKIQGETTQIALVGDLLVISGDDPSIARTLDVVTGKAKSIAKGKVPAPTANGVFFFASLGDKLLDKVKKAAESQTLKVDMTALTIDVGEVSAELRGRVRAVMATAENAQKVKGVVDGLLALASLADEAQKVEAILKRISVTVNGKALEIAVSIPSAELLKIAETMK
ncbi:MAG TPA: hypothetical protein VMZ28_30370 [Kofleriaceae bacterium]|nr:hypothetical protein [Kofleriaceae bacterium]